MSTESTPRERLDRLVAVLGRVRTCWRSTAAIAAIGVALALALALHARRTWRSEATLVHRDVLQTEREGYGSARAARLGPKLQDRLFARGTLASVIDEIGLYPEKRAKSMVEAVDEMHGHVGFRAREGDTYVISFTHDDPAMAQRVTARLTDILLEAYRRESLDAATMTRDFLRRELSEATAKVDAASRALATFLADNPQFQWGINDSPYAPAPQPVAPAPAGGAAAGRRARPADPELESLERRLAAVDAALEPAPRAPAAPSALPPEVVEAQRGRDAAAAALAAAEAALAERLQAVTPIHPDAVAGRRGVEVARGRLAEAEAALRAAQSSAGAAGRAGVAAGGRELDAARRAELEAERRDLLRQSAERRASLRRERASSDRASERAAPPPDADDKRDIVELETEWHRLRLELDRARDYLRSVENSERAADMTADAAEKKSAMEMAILDPAYLPARPERGRAWIFLGGSAMSVLFALGLAGARVLLNDTLYDGDDVAALGGPPVLAEVPRIPDDAPLRERVIVPVYGAGAVAPPRAPTPPRAPAPPRAAATAGAASGATCSARSPAAPRRPRAPAVTLRMGSPLPSDGVGCPADSAVAPAAMPPNGAGTLSGAPVERAAALVVRASFAVACAGSPDELPDVEIVGADVDPEGHGVFELLRRAPPEVIAALRVLRHRLDQRRAGAPLVVAVVSPGSGEGKTALAARLAMTLAEAERSRVILVEGHLERPRVAAALGLRVPPRAGLSHQLRRRMAGEPRPLGVVALGPSLSLLAEASLAEAYPAALHSAHFGAALAALRRRYDYVVIDGPPVLGSGDANVIEDASDSVVLVARAAATRASALSKAAHQLGDRRILGVILNDVAS